MTTKLTREQRWLQAAIVGPHERGARAPAGPASSAGAARHVRPSATLTSAERVEIYSGMYRLRMLEALQHDYPALLAHLGRAGFERLMLAYLARHPSRHYSLNFLGDALPGYLAGARRLKQRTLLRDVARIEHAITAVFDAPASERLDPRSLSTLAPADWQRARLALAEPLELLALDHAANQAVTDLRHGRKLRDARRRRTWVVVYRKEWTVWRMDLERAGFTMLRALQQGRTLPQAIAAGARSFTGRPADFQARLQGWFAEWSAEGLFRSLTLAPRGR